MGEIKKNEAEEKGCFMSWIVVVLDYNVHPEMRLNIKCSLTC